MATAIPAQDGFSQPNCKAIPNEIAMARPVLIASLVRVDTEIIISFLPSHLPSLSFSQSYILVAAEKTTKSTEERRVFSLYPIEQLLLVQSESSGPVFYYLDFARASRGG
jgi:hypothetical protein